MHEGGEWHSGTVDGHHDGECSEIQEAIARRCTSNCDACQMDPTLVVIGQCLGYRADGTQQSAREYIGSLCAGSAGAGGGGKTAGGGSGTAEKLNVPVVTVVSTSAIPTYITFQLAVALPAAAANIYNINGSPTDPMSEHKCNPHSPQLHHQGRG